MKFLELGLEARIWGPVGGVLAEGPKALAGRCCRSLYGKSYRVVVLRRNSLLTTRNSEARAAKLIPVGVGLRDTPIHG
jgi:hypothetical protein